MSEQKESSVLFSLKELMSLEEDRIKTEEADKAAAAAAAEQARMEAERAAREAEEARIRSEAERRRLDEQRTREEHAKLEAIRHAEIEKARLEAEQRARLEAMEAQQKHERSLAAIKQDESKKSLRNMLIGGGLFAALVIGGGGFMVYRNVQETNAREAAQAEAARLKEEDLKKLKAALDDQQKKTDSLIAQLSSAKDDAERARLQKQLAEEQAKTESIKKSSPAGAGGPRPAGDAPPKKKCTPGDPLCTDI
jgi:colicin import membrane protein